MNNKSFNTFVFIILAAMLSAGFAFITTHMICAGDAFNKEFFWKIAVGAFVLALILVIILSSYPTPAEDNTQNNLPIEPTVKYFYNPYTNGHCIVEKILIKPDGTYESEFRLLNEKGEPICEKWYKGVSDFCDDGTALIYDGEMYNFMNKEGKIVSPQWFYDIEPFSDGKAKVRWNDGTINFVNINGEVLWKDWREEILLPKKEDNG